jgi:hypothetical protein
MISYILLLAAAAALIYYIFSKPKWNNLPPGKIYLRVNLVCNLSVFVFLKHILYKLHY